MNMKDKHGRNALSFAVRSGSYPVIQDLLAANIETNVVDDHGDTVVMLAVFRGNAETFERELLKSSNLTFVKSLICGLGACNYWLLVIARGNP